MKFLTTFFGAFYSQTVYRRARLEQRGYGVTYSLTLFVLIAAIGASYVIAASPEELDVLLPEIGKATPMQWMGVAAGALVLRASMLLALAVAARLIAHKFAMAMHYAAAFRIVGIAYTPIAVLDAAMFCATLQPLNPLLLFGCGVAFLFAVLYAVR